MTALLIIVALSLYALHLRLDVLRLSRTIEAATDTVERLNLRVEQSALRCYDLTVERDRIRGERDDYRTIAEAAMVDTAPLRPMPPSLRAAIEAQADV